MRGSLDAPVFSALQCLLDRLRTTPAVRTWRPTVSDLGRVSSDGQLGACVGARLTPLLTPAGAVIGGHRRTPGPLRASDLSSGWPPTYAGEQLFSHL